MLHTILKKLSYLLCILFSSSLFADYSKIYIFGDSLSDTGNLAAVNGGFPPPYDMNRVSNGLVAVEVLADNMGLSAEPSLHLLGLDAGSNYSVAGARAQGAEAIDLGSQVLSFQVTHGFSAPVDALYVMFIGGNDLRDARGIVDKQQAIERVSGAVDAVKQNIESLLSMGATDFLIINAPNIGVIPETLIIDEMEPGLLLKQQAIRVSRLYRKGISDVVETFEHNPKLTIREFDLYKYFNKLVIKAEIIDSINSTDACFSSIDLIFHPDCENGLNADRFLFFDGIHPTARVHELIGNAMYELIE